jgi:hypothetical protein
MGAEDVDFCSLYYLIVEKQVGEAALAQAVSRAGIFGSDRYGQLTLFGPDTEEAKQALDALAAQYESRDSRYPGDREFAVDSVQWELTFERYGWPEQDLPAFESTDPNSPSKPVADRPLKTRQRNSQLYLIGALLAFIRGDYTKEKHPGYETDQQLQQLLRQKTGAPGMSPRNLQTVFKQAKDALETREEE